MSSNAVPPPRWFGFSLTVFLILAAGATLALIIVGALAPVLGALVGGAVPAFLIQRARLIRLPFLLTFLGALIGAALAGLLWARGPIATKAVLSLGAAAIVGLVLAVSGVALWLRTQTRRASA